MDLRAMVLAVVAAAILRFRTTIGVWDIHTHLFSAAFGKLNLWGFDEFVCYHYLVAEFFATRPNITEDAFFALPKPQQADMIWEALFIRRSPISEAC